MMAFDNSSIIPTKLFSYSAKNPYVYMQNSVKAVAAVPLAPLLEAFLQSIFQTHVKDRRRLCGLSLHWALTFVHSGGNFVCADYESDSPRLYLIFE